MKNCNLCFLLIETRGFVTEAVKSSNQTIRSKLEISVQLNLTLNFKSIQCYFKYCAFTWLSLNFGVKSPFVYIDFQKKRQI